MKKTRKKVVEETKCVNCDFETNGDFTCSCGNILCESCSDAPCNECQYKKQEREDREEWMWVNGED